MNSTNIRIQIDGQSKEFDIESAGSFEHIMRTVQDSIDLPGVSITRVSLNGEDITGKSWEGFAHLSIDEIMDIKVETGNFKQLAFDTLISLSEFISKLVDELERTSEQLRLGNVIQGGESLTRCLDGIQLVNHTTAMVGRNLEIETRFTPGNGNSIESNLKNLEPIVEDMLTAQTDQDWVLLADLIEYELIPHFTDRMSLLNAWKEKGIG